MNLREKEKVEIDFWKNSESESPENFTTYNLLNKIGEAKFFYEIIQGYKEIFRNSPKILELGAGQGWASCIIKKEFGQELITSDISEYAVQSIKYWEGIFNVKIDHSLACTSYEIPLEDESIDLVFCFAAAHHFVKHKRSFQEINRILKPGGHCLYLYEPSCLPYLYRWQYKRVNRIRTEVPEDVLIYNRILKIARNCGFKARIDFFPIARSSSFLVTNYYFLLRSIPLLARLLPCNANFVFQKKG